MAGPKRPGHHAPPARFGPGWSSSCRSRPIDQVLALLGEHDPTGGRLPVAIETSQGLLLAGLRAAGRQAFAINPLAVSRCWDRYRASCGKSEAFDAMVLANILRTDATAHRPLPADSELLQSLRVVTRAQQDAAWDQITLTNRIRTLLRMFSTAALAAFERGGRHRLDSPAARMILAAAPTPAAAAALAPHELAALLRCAGRQRGIAAEADKLHGILRGEQMRQPAAVEQAMGLHLQGLVRQLDAICQTLQQLEQRVDEVFRAHPDAKIVTSVPGLGVQLGARLLAEIGDDRSRFADARALRAFAGAAPVTRSSGKSSFVHARPAKTDPMNWSQAQLDGRLPITLRTAEQVKKILRFRAPSDPIASRYAQYMGSAAPIGDI
ncbi:transposase [Micromonospora sp. R77]|uniref:IS110 family transposase n=1 Tax=Micromonospora sp. R77 TaxID=2925836 RepID=UPI001F6194A7|nr:transposase [Micromonospora sp. R77]MCI4061443.1 transposase [Micromonospora sp. R77]